MKDIRELVIKYLNSNRIGNVEYRISTKSSASIFASIFALYITDLIDEVDKLDANLRREWATYINSFQDPKTGLYLPLESFQKNVEVKPVFQLTAFSLSALNILAEKPTYELTYLLQKWKTVPDIEYFLHNQGCFIGKPTSGNMAMFQGIFLTYFYNLYEHIKYKEMLNHWFALHDRFQNIQTGFWGKSYKSKNYWGFQNAFHQFVIYEYWEKQIQHADIIINNILQLQDKNGLYGILPGGGGCWDYDANHLLLLLRGHSLHDKCSKTMEKINHSLNKSFNYILENNNADGGYQELLTKNSIFKLCEALLHTKPSLILPKVREMIKLVNNEANQSNHWSIEKYPMYESDLWNTWFRLLTIAEIDTYLNPDNTILPWKFQNFIGLGYKKNQKSVS